jgi:lipoprotein Spr
MRKQRPIYPVVTLTIFSIFLWDGCHSSKKITRIQEDNSSPQAAYMPVKENPPPVNNNPKKEKHEKQVVLNNEATRESSILSTYAEKLGVSKTDITNYKLYNFIDLWYGTPYKYAGRSMSGVDCSDFVSLLVQSVYGIDLSGDVVAIYRQCKHIKPSQLKEGDLVFFKLNRRSLSHVGVYLQNHKFVHASVHSGVVIDDLHEDYYKKYFRLAGRILK